MALICVYGGECNGCGFCQETEEKPELEDAMNELIDIIYERENDK